MVAIIARQEHAYADERFGEAASSLSKEQSKRVLEGIVCFRDETLTKPLFLIIVETVIAKNTFVDFKRERRHSALVTRIRLFSAVRRSKWSRVFKKMDDVTWTLIVSGINTIILWCLPIPGSLKRQLKSIRAVGSSRHDRQTDTLQDQRTTPGWTRLTWGYAIQNKALRDQRFVLDSRYDSDSHFDA